MNGMKCMYKREQFLTWTRMPWSRSPCVKWNGNIFLCIGHFRRLRHSTNIVDTSSNLDHFLAKSHKEKTKGNSSWNNSVFVKILTFLTWSHRENLFFEYFLIKQCIWLFFSLGFAVNNSQLLSEISVIF
jgi:hypothetical protein